MAQALATAAETKPLYDLMAQIKALAPWDWMEETDVFGVQNPETGELGFISIMGMAGEHFAIAVYQGAEGIYGFERMQELQELLNPEDVLEVPQLQASFEDRDMLDKRDRDHLKELKLKYRGRDSWVLFRAYSAGYAPWFISSAHVSMLRTALEQVLDVAPRFKDNEDMLYSDEDYTYLVRQRNENGEWSDVWMTIPEPKAKLIPVAIESSLMEAAKKLPQSHANIQAGFFMLPSPIQESPTSVPYFTYALPMLDTSSGMIMGAELLQPNPTMEAMLGKLLNTALKIIVKSGKRPRRIEVASERLYEQLQPLDERLNIKVKLRDWLPEMEMVRASLISSVSGGGEF